MQATASKPRPRKAANGRSTEVDDRPKASGTTRAATAARHQDEGHGRRLTNAFDALEAFPALAESRNRLLAVMSSEHVATADIVTAVESDVALIIAVLRIANQIKSPPTPSTRARVDTVVAAVELLSPEIVQTLAGRVRTFEFFERSSVWNAAPERFRLHALATQRAADRVATEVGYEHRDRLTVTSLLHDIGKLVLLHAYPGYPAQVHLGAETPEERIHQERRELGVDHALVGGAGGCPPRSPPRSSAITTPMWRARRLSSASRTCSRTTSRAPPCPRRKCCGPRGSSASPRRSSDG
jgi:hypothetical protein